MEIEGVWERPLNKGHAGVDPPRKRKPMRTRPSFLVITVLALTLAGCCPSQVAYVPVREARFRSEATRQERLQLPLTAESREYMLKFLRAGGDTDRLGQEVADPEAESRYAPLLDLLSDARNLTLADLTEKATYRAWFQGPVIRQVIDAREEAPPAIDPVAVTDGKYWWIFFHRHRELRELLVVKAIPKTLDR